ncbi:MAG: B12-binding domain-containing radical SAM protein [Endomicrobia bacterium]|nr:B12-binding domain-containing radical SAM protein [Endomicrobiia bacterium]
MKNVVVFHPSVGYMDKLRTKPSLPLNLLSAVSILSKYYEVRIIDERLEPHWKKIIKDKIDSSTVCIGVTSLTGRMILSSLEFCKFVKLEYGIPVVWGGIHSSLLPKQVLENKYIDFVVVGEGEETFFELVSAIDNKTSVDKVKGIFYKCDGRIVGTGHREFVDLNTLPELPYHLVEISEYLPLYKGRRSVYFESSRGCPFRCSYCYNNVFNRRTWRCLSAEETIRRIKNLVFKYPQIEDIYFVDDNFFVDLERARKIVYELKKLGLSWQVQGVDIISLKRMDEEFYKLLYDSGLSRLTVGIESGSQKMRDIMRKQGTKKDIIEVFKKLAKYDITIYTSFLVGLPSETKMDIKETVKLLFCLFKVNKNLRNSPFYIYTPYPGTELFNYVVSKGYKVPQKLEDWAECEWDSIKHKRLKKFYEDIHFVSMFVDNKIKEYQTKFKLLKFLFYLYRPFARLRLRYLFFWFLLEKRVFELAKKVLKV